VEVEAVESQQRETFQGGCDERKVRGRVKNAKRAPHSKSFKPPSMEKAELSLGGGGPKTFPHC